MNVPLPLCLVDFPLRISLGYKDKEGDTNLEKIEGMKGGENERKGGGKSV